MAEQTMEKDERKRALDLALSQIEKQYGKGAIMKLGSAEIPANVPAISTGSLGLDIALGVGGLPRGRVIEIFGPEASGKTTLTLHTIAEAQKNGGVTASSTRNMPWTSAMHASSGSRPMSCWSPSRIQASRRSK